MYTVGLRLKLCTTTEKLNFVMKAHGKYMAIVKAGKDVRGISTQLRC